MENVIASTALFERPEYNPRTLVWTGRVLTGLIVAFLAVDAVGKLIPLAPYVEGTQKVGYAVTLLRPLGLAYFGGAVATHLRTGTSFWFPIAFAVILWAAYAMRSPRFRAFLLSTLR